MKESDSLSTRVSDVSGALSAYSGVLSRILNEAEWIRQDAVSGGLKVSGTLILAPEDSSDDEKRALYNSLSVRMGVTRADLSTAQQDLRTSLTPDDIKNIYQVFSIVLEGGVKYLSDYVDAVMRRGLFVESIRLAAMAHEVESSILARYGSVAMGAARAQAKAANEALNFATDLRAKASQHRDESLHIAGSSKILKIAGSALTVIGTGVGIIVDYANGESLPQATVSNVAASIAGTVAATAAGTAAGAATGAAIGSIVPGAGTVVGFVVGAGTGFVVSTFTDETIDSLIEDKQGIAHAAEEGLNAVVPDFVSDNVREDASRAWSDINESVTEMDRQYNRAS